MKICYDMIEGMYLTTRGNLKKGNHVYEYNPTPCECCGEEFLVCAGRVSKFCSKSCNSKITSVGRKLSEKVKEKLSRIHLGDKNHMHGRSGPLSPTWKHDKTNEERINKRCYTDYYYWRKKTYKRDNYTCMLCGDRGGVLNAHHIESYNSNKDLRTKLSNSIILCVKCHKDFHHQYGRGYNTREQFNEYKELL
jgi:hypothetical protein